MLETGLSTEALLAATIANLRRESFEAHLGAWLASCIAHDNVTTLAYFQDRAPLPFRTKSRQPQVHAAFENLYLTGAYLLDPFHDLHLEHAPAGMYRLSDIAPDQFQRNRYFLDYYRSTTMIDEIGFVSYPSKGVSLHVCLGRDKNSNQRFNPREIATAKRIAPIVVELSQAHWKDLVSKGELAEGDLVSDLIAAVSNTHSISLSPRQAQVALLVMQGHSSVSTGLRLGISPQTVKVFRKQLYKKCSISSQAELFTLMLPLLGSGPVSPAREGQN